MKKIILCIMDGIGISNNKYKNAFYNANTKNLDKLFSEYPNTLLSASGIDVGLPPNQMGNSEVGHSNIGAGRVVYQSLEYINKEIENKEFFNNKVLLDSVKHAKDNGSNLHIMGLISDGGIHSHINHLLSLLDFIKSKNYSNVYLHLFTDGRDTKVDSSMSYISILEDKIKKIGIGKIVSVSGRFYAMDRDNRYERVSKFYEACVNANATNYGRCDLGIKANYEAGNTDEFIEPFIVDGGKKIMDNDSVIIFNFRPDRLREIILSLTNNINELNTRIINNLKITTMMPVVDNKYSTSIFSLPKVNNSLGVYLSSLSYSQLRIAETEKYAHVTYFFDGGDNYDLKGEDKILINSPKVKTYDMKPEMSAYEITDTLIDKVNKNSYDLVVLNFANGDMVGHTGNYLAAIKAVEAVDDCIGKIVENIDLSKYTLIITADHGNCEVMENSDGSVNTNHTTNKVPFIILDKNITLKDGKLANIAPTILDIMKIEKPIEMNSDSLILK